MTYSNSAFFEKIEKEMNERIVEMAKEKFLSNPEYAKELAGISTDEKYNAVIQKDILFEKIAQAIVEGMKAKKWNMFYRPWLGDIIEVGEFEDKINEIKRKGMKNINACRFINLIQDKIRFCQEIYEKDTDKIRKRFFDIKDNHAKLIMQNSYLIQNMPKINKILSYNTVFTIKDQLIHTKNGYNENLHLFVLEDAPPLKQLVVDEAKAVIDEILRDFCFESEQDKMMAIAYLCTPFARTLYKNKFARTPVFLIKANRERAGKDYLAGVVGLIYENQSINYPPISTGKESDNEELRKRVMSVMMCGGKLYHSQNNKGNLNNAFFETITTAEQYSDRLLGKNESVTLNNELDFSLSANIGLTYTADLFNRARLINLFYSEEDANSRQFSKPDLHGWIKINREHILNSLYTLYMSWYLAGKPEPKTAFTSFPEWYKVVGGMMEYHGYGDIGMSQKDDMVGGDYINTEMRKLFQYFSGHIKREWRTTEIVEELKEKNPTEDIAFTNLNLEIKQDKANLSKMIVSYKSRVLDNIRLKIKVNSERTARIMWIFEQEQPKVGPKTTLNPFVGYIAQPKSVGQEFLDATIEQKLNLLKKLATNGQIEVDSVAPRLELLSDQLQFELGILAKNGQIFEKSPKKWQFL
jgi:hypothetical protein